MIFIKPYPFNFLLEKTEEATGSAPVVKSFLPSFPSTPSVLTGKLFSNLAWIFGSSARIFLQELWPRPGGVNVTDLRPKSGLIKKSTS